MKLRLLKLEIVLVLLCVIYIFFLCLALYLLQHKQNKFQYIMHIMIISYRISAYTFPYINFFHFKVHEILLALISYHFINEEVQENVILF